MKRCLVLLFLVAGCTVGPDYVRPTMEIPAAYKDEGHWKPAEPRDASARGRWWAAFGDAELDSLMSQIEVSNQTLAAAEAQIRIATAIAEQSRAAWWPTVGGTVQRIESLPSATTGPIAGTTTSRRTIDYAALNASWEADLWGRVRRLVESGDAAARASGADLVNAHLSVQATLAQNYFLLRALDTQKGLLDETAAAYTKMVELTGNRYRAGVASRADVVQAEAQLHSTRAQAIDLGVQRAQFENAIAVLLGRPAPGFSLAVGSLPPAPPPVPATGVPAQLLERRPDIAAAERRVEAANAQIGVAKAAFFPAATLGATIGYQTATSSLLFTSPSLFWSVGPALAMTLFDGGRRRAISDQALASYDQTVANYRGTVLQAFADVEDNLAALRILEAEAAVQQEALTAAQRSLEITLNQYNAGITTYLQVVIAQAVALQARNTALGIRARRFVASVQLVRALGGGWAPE